MDHETLFKETANHAGSLFEKKLNGSRREMANALISHPNAGAKESMKSRQIESLLRGSENRDGGIKEEGRGKREEGRGKRGEGIGKR